MNYGDLEALYEKWKRQYGLETYRYVSTILTEAKAIHHADWLKRPTASGDHEQSWRAFKGKNLEKLVQHMIEEEVGQLGLGIIPGNTLERTTPRNLSLTLDKVRRGLLVPFGEFGDHLPDVDLVIFDPTTCQVIAVVSSKVTLRERIAQTGYWKLKLLEAPVTRNVKVFFVTPDEDDTLKVRKPAKKGRAIVEVDTDGAYVFSETDIEPSEKVKSFDHFVDDLRQLLVQERKRS